MNRNTRNILRRKLPIAALLITLLMGSMSAHAESPGKAVYRVAVGGDQFSGTTEVAGVFHLQSWQRWGADRLEVTVGVLGDGTRTRPFLSVGPVWHRPIGQSHYFLEFGISPTLISRPTFEGQDLGGSFHFTSAVVFGAEIGRHGFVGLRLQHTSNGGLHEVNPGMEMLGITFSLSGG